MIKLMDVIIYMKAIKLTVLITYKHHIFKLVIDNIKSALKTELIA